MMKGSFLLVAALLAISLCLAVEAKEKHKMRSVQLDEISVGGATADHCNAYPTCIECLSHSLCGWCSTPVVYQDGAQGYQCAGFNPGSNTSSSDPFICYGIYSTEQCEVGYNCQTNTSTCVMAAPGDGVPLTQCNATCSSSHGGGGNGTTTQTYSCLNNTCTKVPPGHGTSLEICQSSCGQNPHANNGTPAILIGVWRGLQINSQYVKGEYDLDFSAYTVEISSPAGDVVSADVGTLGPYLVFNYTSGPNEGKTVYILWGLYTGPVTVWATFAFSAPNGQPPINFDIAMSTSGQSEFVFVRCLSDTYCNFTFDPSSWVSQDYYTVESMAAQANITDHCSPYPNCTVCLEQQYCGWCSTPVVYQDGSTGAQCAGFNDNTTNPFKCFGTYSTEECPGPAPTYLCDNATKTCKEASPGEGTSFYICNQTCGAPPPPPPPPPAKTYVCVQANQSCVEAPPGHGSSLYVCNQTCANPNNGTGNGTTSDTYICNNFNKTCEKTTPGHGTSLTICNQTCGQVIPPPAFLNGVWRGLEVNVGYLSGEWDAKFANDSLTLVDPSGKTYTGQIEMSGGYLQISFTDGTLVFAQFQNAFGPETIYLTFAVSAPNAALAPDFVTAMDTAGDTEFIFIRCLDGSTTCSFSF